MSRLSSVVLTGSAQVITLPVYGGKTTDEYILTGADGLGPPEIDVALAQSVYRGGVYQGSSSRDREIVFLVGLNPRYSSTKTIADLRADFYKLMAGPDPLTIEFNIVPSVSGDFVPDAMGTIGYIRRIEIAPFTKSPQVQVTIACPSPVFDGADFIDVPYVPESFSSAAFTFQYEGTAPVGFEYKFTMNTAPTKVTLMSTANGGPPEVLSITGPRVQGETFDIQTDAAAGRRVYWTNPAVPGAYGDITGMAVVTPDRWPSLHPGTNVIQLLDHFDVPLPTIPRGIRYKPKYWGL